MAFNLFDFSNVVGSKLNPLGNTLNKPQASPTQVGGATGGGMIPPTTSAQPLPSPPVDIKPSTPETSTSSIVTQAAASDLGKMNIDTFAQKIKAKYPQYASLDNTELTNKIVAKYPQYKEQIDFGTPSTSTVSTITPEVAKQETGIFNSSEGLIPESVRFGSLDNPFSSEEIRASSNLGAGAKRVGNFAAGVVDFLGTLGNTALHPADTLQGVVDTGAQGLAKIWEGVGLIDKGDINTDKIDALGNYLKRYNFTSEEGRTEFMKQLDEHPFSIIGDITSVLSGGASGGAKVAELADLTKTANVLNKTAKVVDVVNPYIATTKGAIKTLGAPAEYLKNAPEKAKQAEVIDWAEPSTQLRGYVASRKIADNAKNFGTNIPEELVKNKIELSKNTTDGKFDTAETAASLREDAGKLSQDMVRPALAKADLTTPPTPVSEISKEVLSRFDSEARGTPDSIKAQRAKIVSQLKGLEKKHPDGMSLTELHDAKIDFSKESKYNQFGITAENNTAKANEEIASSLRTMVEKKAPADLPIKEFNAELQKKYQMADYLESLHGKNVPKGTASKLLKAGAKLAGAGIGHSIAPGLLGGVAGYHIGGSIESFIENMPNPIRTKFLNNLKTTNPEAFKQMNSYLNK